MNGARSIYKLLQHNQLANATVRNYAFKSDLKIKWVRPEKIPCYKPKKSGDLQPMPKVDDTQFAYDFRNSKELQTADDLVKTLFSLQFAPRKKTTQVYIRSVIDTVRRHPMDVGSIEARIARWTGAIRALQEQMEVFPRNKKLKVNLKELIDKRKKHLKYLRRWDYKKFEWILETLNIVYKPPPNEFKWVTRKDSLRKLTQTYCDKIREDRLEEYRLKLEEEQPALLEEKIRSLEFIRDEQKDCGVEVTIKQEDIDEAKMLLNKIREEQARREKDD